MTRLSYILFFLICIVFAPSAYAQAQDEFTSAMDVHYVFSRSGTATVTYDVTLTNARSEIYPRGFTFRIASPDISNVVAYDAGGHISPDLVHNADSTELSVAFHNRSVGLGNNLPFTVRFQSDSFARRTGSVWDIEIPKAPDDAGLIRYTVSFDAPPEFGQLASVYPAPEDGYHWNKDQLSAGGIHATFGDEQHYRLEVKYELSAPVHATQKASIIIPPDSLFQEVAIAGIRPLPALAQRSPNGSWIGYYFIKSGQRVTVDAVYFITVYRNPRLNWTGEESGRTDVYSARNAFDSGTIAGIAAEVRSPEEIYSYLTHTFSFNPKNNLKTGSLSDSIFQNSQNAGNREFTDAFIFLNSAAGIPVRKVIGIAISDDPNEPIGYKGKPYHTWAEYFDTTLNLWLPADPTWGQTTGRDYFSHLDFRHITLAAYDDISPGQSDDNLAQSIPNQVTSLEILDQKPQLPGGKVTTRLLIPPIHFSGLPLYGKVEVENTTTLPIDKLIAKVDSSDMSFNFKTELSDLTAYSKRETDFTVPATDIYRFGLFRFNGVLNNETVMSRVLYLPVLPAAVFCLSLYIISKLIPPVRRGFMKLWKSRKKH